MLNNPDCDINDKNNCAEEVKDMKISRNIPHPQYGNKRNPALKYDIALIRMEEEIMFSRINFTLILIQIVALPFHRR